MTASVLCQPFWEMHTSIYAQKRNTLLKLFGGRISVSYTHAHNTRIDRG